MADKPASEKTEKPTPERLKKAREEGKVTESQEVSSAMMIGGLLLMLGLTAGWLYSWFVSQVRDGLSFHLAGPISVATFGGLLHAKCIDMFVVLLPFLLGMAAVSVFASLLVGGWAFSPKALRLDLKRLSPIRGMKNLISLRSVIKLLISMAKLAILLVLTWSYLSSRVDLLLSLQWASAEGTLVTVAGLIFGLGGRIVLALMVIAGADLLYQRWNYRRQLRMTKQETREERKQHEVSPEVKSRIRAAQMAMARKRMLQDVATASVVVTNPTHYAVALRYDSETMQAPQVVAKGADFICEKIKEIARENDVPIIEKPELAQALYGTAKLGESIPDALFVAVAEILAMIYRLRKKNPASGRRTDR